MKPYHVNPTASGVEVWSGCRIQFGGQEAHPWQKALKAELKDVLAQKVVPGAPLTAYYDTTHPAVVDVENSLFTNMLEAMPGGVTLLRFERGAHGPPQPPVEIELAGGHLHYYRYMFGGQWVTWQPDEALARWERVPRRVSDDETARPVWFALRDGHESVTVPGGPVGPDVYFGLRLVVHASRFGPRNAVTYSERLVDGTIAAFHDDRFSPELLALLRPKFPKLSEEDLHRALENQLGPLFTGPAIKTAPGFVQFSPADERCILGEVAIVPDSESPWPELSGELFTVRRVD